MLIWLVDLSEHVKFFNLFRYITFRTGGALFTSALIVFLFGPRIISSLRVRQGKGQPIRAGCKGLNEQIGTLEVPEHADIGEVDRVRSRRNGPEIALVDAVVDQPCCRYRHPHLALVGLPFEIADEDQRVGEMLLEAFQLEHRTPERGAPREMQAATMGGIEAGNAILVHPQG